jgi:hypothetical protein
MLLRHLQLTAKLNWLSFITITTIITTITIDGIVRHASSWCRPDGIITIITTIFIITTIITITTFIAMTTERNRATGADQAPVALRSALLISGFFLGCPMQMAVSAIKDGVG